MEQECILSVLAFCLKEFHILHSHICIQTFTQLYMCLKPDSYNSYITNNDPKIEPSSTWHSCLEKLVNAYITYSHMVLNCIKVAQVTLPPVWF